MEGRFFTKKDHDVWTRTSCKNIIITSATGPGCHLPLKMSKGPCHVQLIQSIFCYHTTPPQIKWKTCWKAGDFLTFMWKPCPWRIHGTGIADLYGKYTIHGSYGMFISHSLGILFVQLVDCGCWKKSLKDLVDNMEQPIIDTPCYHAWPLNWLFELVVCSGWQDQLFFYLVFEPTHLKNMLVKLDHFPRDRGENKKCLKPPPSF